MDNLAQLLMNRDDAEEVAAEAFTELSRMQSTPRDPEAFLWTVAQRRAFDRLRKRDNEAEATRDFAVLTGTDIGRGRFDGVADLREVEARTDLQDAMAMLDEDDLVAWAYTELRGLTTREAADALGVSYPTVSRRAERARLTLKEKLA